MGPAFVMMLGGLEGEIYASGTLSRSGSISLCDSRSVRATQADPRIYPVFIAIWNLELRRFDAVVRLPFGAGLAGPDLVFTRSGCR